MTAANIISTQPQKRTNVRMKMGLPSWIRVGFGTAGRIAPGPTSAVAAHLFRRTRRSAPRPGEREVLRTAVGSRVAGMQVWSWGEGPTVLLVHGWNGRATQLGSLVDPLVARGYRVVAFDAIGHGESVGSQSSLPELANCIRQVVEEVGGVFAIVAHSLGGAATTFALAYGMQVERAVFIAPPADPREFLALFSSSLGIGEEVSSRVKTLVERRLGVPMEEMRASKIAPMMNTPLLVIHDREDKEVPFQVGRVVASAWPGAELITTKGLGHQRILRDPAVMNAAVDFVDAQRHRRRAA